MTDYKQLEQKVAELQKEIERLKKEEKENSLPCLFNQEYSINVLKAVDSQNVNDFRKALFDAFQWISTSQGWDYWNVRYYNINRFDDKDYAQIQKWIIMSFQQETGKH